MESGGSDIQMKAQTKQEIHFKKVHFCCADPSHFCIICIVIVPEKRNPQIFSIKFSSKCPNSKPLLMFLGKNADYGSKFCSLFVLCKVNSCVFTILFRWLLSCWKWEREAYSYSTSSMMKECTRRRRFPANQPKKEIKNKQEVAQSIRFIKTSHIKKILENGGKRIFVNIKFPSIQNHNHTKKKTIISKAKSPHKTTVRH